MGTRGDRRVISDCEQVSTSSEVLTMSAFVATHQLVAPAGEEIPVMLVSQPESIRYLVVSEIEHEEEIKPFYEWHPSEGVTYQGFKLDGLNILPLESTQTRSRTISESIDCQNCDWSVFQAL